MTAKQATVAGRVELDGVGLHSGVRVRLEILPAPPGTGRVFVRLDRQPAAEIPVRPESLVAGGRGRQTTLGSGGVFVRTVEHLLAALYAAGIDNARLALTAEEVPDAGDGSAAPFVEALESAGRLIYDAPRAALILSEAVRVAEGEAWVSAEPHDGFVIACTYSHPRVGVQSAEIAVGATAFAQEVAPARTFGFTEEVEQLRAAGLALGATLDNALVIGDDGPLAHGWRFPDECVRHKVLDVIGDLSILGSDLRMRVTSHRAGHRLNGLAVQRLAECVRREETG